MSFLAAQLNLLPTVSVLHPVRRGNGAGVLNVCAVTEAEAGVLDLIETSRRQLLPEKLLPEQHSIVRNVTLAGRREGEDDEFVLKQRALGKSGQILVGVR